MTLSKNMPLAIADSKKFAWALSGYDIKRGVETPNELMLGLDLMERVWRLNI